MKYYWLFSLGLFFLAATGCKDDNPVVPNPPAYKLTFNATYGGEHLELFKSYDYGTFPVKWSRFNLYISDVILLKGTEEVKFADVAFLNFAPENATTNVTPSVVLSSTAIPAGDYTGIRIGFGVKPSLNAKKPSDFSPNDPLYLESEYWPGWLSYIFSKIEGSADTDNNGTIDLDLVYHCGGNQTYKVFDFNHNFTVGTDGGNMSIDLDLKKLFTFNGQLYDVVAVPTSSHGQSGVDLMTQLQNNYSNAIEMH